MARTYFDTPEPRHVEKAAHCDDPNSDYDKAWVITDINVQGK